MNWLPLLHRSIDVKFIIFGGGQVAQRKVKTLIKFTQAITVVSPLLDSRLQTLADDNGIQHIKSLAKQEHVLAGNYIVAATDNGDVNQQIGSWAKALLCPVSIADNPDQSDFIFPAIIDRDPVMIAISSASESPALTRYLRNQLDAALSSRIPQLAQFTSRLRRNIRTRFDDSKKRQQLWRRLMSSAMPNLVLAGKEDQAEDICNNILAGNDHCGEVFLVGAGPGDPELLTLKAVRLIQQADVVFYDRLVSSAILEYCNSKAEMYYVGKAMADHAVPQEDINQLLADHARLGKTVLRLKGGDPFIFGRGGEEIELLAEQKIPFQVVPGITAASGCSSYAGIPLTHRDYAQSVRFVTGHLKDGSTNLPWNELIHPQQTLVIYMGLTGISHISQELIAHGMSSDTPIALIEKGTRPEQKVYTSTLAEISNVIDNNSISAPTLTIIGDVVKLHKKLDWFS
jgi:uroporphyrin-III C-methyltransferase/precorrin-2 dehydrogenase/sirohydrochlorin ferrochelatase